jgi:hypothetical protein
MDDSPFWETDSRSTTQEISHILWDPKSISVFIRARYRSL